MNPLDKVNLKKLKPLKEFKKRKRNIVDKVLGAAATRF